MCTIFCKVNKNTSQHQILSMSLMLLHDVLGKFNERFVIFLYLCCFIRFLITQKYHVLIIQKWRMQNPACAISVCYQPCIYLLLLSCSFNPCFALLFLFLNPCFVLLSCSFNPCFALLSCFLILVLLFFLVLLILVLFFFLVLLILVLLFFCLRRWYRLLFTSQTNSACSDTRCSDS